MGDPLEPPEAVPETVRRGPRFGRGGGHDLVERGEGAVLGQTDPQPLLQRQSQLDQGERVRLEPARGAPCPEHLLGHLGHPTLDVPAHGPSVRALATTAG
jgi:hypothetical protein